MASSRQSLQEADMKLQPTTFLLAVCVCFSTGVWAQSGAAGSQAGSPTASNPPAHDSGATSNPNPAASPSPDSSAINTQNNNPAAAGQNSPTTNGNMPINPRGPQTPPTIGTSPAPSPAQSATGPVTAATSFTTLDRSNKGYLTTTDVASDKYLAAHFQQCDINGDGRLTQNEVSGCLQQAPPKQ
jgi:hypothetical protein